MAFACAFQAKLFYDFIILFVIVLVCSLDKRSPVLNQGMTVNFYVKFGRASSPRSSVLAADLV